VSLALVGCGGAGGAADSDTADLQDTVVIDTQVPSDTDHPDTATPVAPSVFLSAAEIALLDDASAAYRDALASGTPTTARQALLAWLDARPEVAAAGLAADGHTVALRLGDGRPLFLDTVDHDGMREGAEAALTELGADLATRSGALSTDAPALTIASLTGGPWVPGSKRAAFLNISAPEFPLDATAIETIVDDLKERGWTDDDLDVLTRTHPNDPVIHLGTLGDLADYGVVVVFAHGTWVEPAAYGDAIPGEDPSTPHFYLEWMSATSYDGVVDAATVAQWTAWAEEGKLVPMREVTAAGGYFALTVRDDLVDELLGPLPDSLVVLVVCHGWRARDVFRGHGAAAFIGWDDAVRSASTYPLVIPLFRYLASTVPAATVQQVFAGPNVLRDGTTGEGEPSIAHLDAASDATWLPAWVDVEVPAATIPEGPTHLSLDLDFAPSLIPWKPSVSIAASDGPTLSVGPVPPQTAWLVVTALDAAGDVVRRKRDTVTLLPGANWLQEPLPAEQLAQVERVYTTYTCPPVADPPCHGVTSTRFFRWKAVAGHSRYTGVVDTQGYSDGGWTTGKVLDLSPSSFAAGACRGPGTGGCPTNQCYQSREQVLACFGGVDPFDMAEDDLVYYLPFGVTCVDMDPDNADWLDYCLSDPDIAFTAKDDAGAAATAGWTLSVVPF